MKRCALAISIVLGLAACAPSHNSYGGGGGGGDGKQGGEETEAGGFAEVNAKIFTPRCSGCHANFTSYQIVAANLPDIQQAIESNKMPKGGPALTDDLKTLLNEWIDKGAPE